LPKYIAFLRAINVGGRQVKMAELAEHFKAIGYADVETVITTGNVIFDTESQPTEALALDIETKLEPLLGFKSEVFVRSAAEITAILAMATTLSPQVPANGELNVAFLSRSLTEAQATTLAGLSNKMDQFVVQDREVYWICQVPQNASKFSNGVFEQKLKVRSTFRRVSTLSALPETLFA
jgi:uncharacterized protein (DUF1697 family)